MSSFLPIHRPRVGISFRAHALDLVEIRRGWRRVPTVTRLAARPLPAGLLTPTTATPNISDPAALTKELQALFQNVRDRAVAVDLPIACGMLALFHFEMFPIVRAEQEALLRWRLRQEEHLTIPDLKILWQVFPAAEQGLTAVSVLLVAIRQSILDQYHRVCEEADLLPVSMGLSTIHLLSLVRSAFCNKHEDLFVAHRTAESLVVLAVRQGRPVGLRVKPVRRAGMDLKAELIQTLQYFANEGAPARQAATRTTPLYIVEEEDPAPALSERQDQTEIWTLSEDPSWAVPVHRARWVPAPIISTVAHPVHPPFAALAGVLAA